MRTNITNLIPLINARESYLTNLLSRNGYARSQLINGKGGYWLFVDGHYEHMGNYYINVIRTLEAA